MKEEFACPIFIKARPGFCLRDRCKYFSGKETCGFLEKIKRCQVKAERKTETMKRELIRELEKDGDLFVE